MLMNVPRCRQSTMGPSCGGFSKAESDVLDDIYRGFLDGKHNRHFCYFKCSHITQSFQFGRPPSVSLSYADCPLPQEIEEIVGPDGPETSCMYILSGLLIHADKSL